MENTVNTTNDALCGEGCRGSVQQHPSFLSVTNMGANHETGLQGEVGDFITILASKSPLLTKMWNADGTITGHGRAKQHTVRTVPVANIRDAAVVFEKLRSLPTSGIVRGEWIGLEASARVPDPDGEREMGYVLRQMPYFHDIAHHWILLDIDGYEPLLADPVTEPEAAIAEWIRFNLPPEFHGVTCYWHLSSSAGHPSKAGTLRAHLVFWLNRKLTSPEAAGYVTMAKIPVDRAPLHVIQLSYTADPVFAPGVVDPVTHRAGLLEGPRGDVVELELDEGALTVAVLEMRRGNQTSGGGEGGVALDPRQKKGLVGAFCRAFSIEDVLMAVWFPGNFERVTDRRWTWLDSGGSLEGAYITEDRQRFVVTHNSSPQNTIGKGLNSWDLTRVYKFGALDEAVPEDQRTFWLDMPGSRPSEGAMKTFALSLPEVKAELDAARANDNPFTLAQAEQAQEAAERTVATAESVPMFDLLGPPPVMPLAAVPAPEFIDTPQPATHDSTWGLVMGEQLKQRLFAMGLTDDERAELIDGKALSSAWLGCFYNPGNSKMYLMNKAGQVVQFGPTRWQKMIQQTFGKFIVADTLAAVSLRLSTERSTDRADVEKEIRKLVWDAFVDNVELYRQRSEVSYRVDMFAVAPRVVLTQGRAEITYTHEDFKVRPSGLSAAGELAIVEEYKGHFPLFETILALLLHARFASDRRKAFLHMQCMAGWGKGFLVDGILGPDGLNLLCPMNVKDIERGFEGAPSAIQAADVVQVWGLVFDEFKAVKGELKMLNNRISAAPKNQLRFTAEVYLKLFLSAESVDSLGGSEGVEAQFADRFAFYCVPDGSRSIDDLELFKRYGKMAYRNALSNYAAASLNAGVARMRALGQGAASKAGDDWLDQFHLTYGIGNSHGLLSDQLPKIAEEITKIINDWALHVDKQGTDPSIEYFPPAFKLKLSKAVKVITGRIKAGEAPERLIVATRLSGVVKDYIYAFIEISQRILVGYKVNAIVELITGRDFNKSGHYYDEGGKQQSIRGAVLRLTRTPELLAAAAAFGAADVLRFPEQATKA